jgi:hypothetical protein
MAGRPKGPGKGINFDPAADLIDPLDYLILGALPEEGTMIAGAYPDGRTSKQLSRELFNSEVTPSQIGPRMNALVYHSLVVKKKGIGVNGAFIYQRTPKGDEVYDKWVTDHTEKTVAQAVAGND